MVFLVQKLPVERLALPVVGPFVPQRREPPVGKKEKGEAGEDHDCRRQQREEDEERPHRAESPFQEIRGLKSDPAAGLHLLSEEVGEFQVEGKQGGEGDEECKECDQLVVTPADFVVAQGPVGQIE